MIKRTLARFATNRRSAVAVIMALSLAPLVLLVGIAVDFTFLYQSRTQTAFASEAAASQALRIAAATYALEVAHGATDTAASARAITAGETAGNLWFSADLGALTRATLSSPGTTTVINTNPNGPSVGAPVFQATVTDSATYPPIFAPLFGNPNTQWSYNSNATGTTSYAYAQILLMLDTSGSMFIGADPPDIATLEEGTVCPAAGAINPSDGSGAIPGSSALINQDYESDVGANDHDYVNLDALAAQTPNPIHYIPGNTDGNYIDGTVNGGNQYGRGSPQTFNGTCQSNYGPTATQPCALACHFSTNPNTANGHTYSADYYGLARQEGVTLRVDVLFNATENVISDMENSEAVANQLSVGVYQFNTDVFPIVTSGAGDALPEATSNLSGALSAVQNIDYKNANYHTAPTNVVVPQLINFTGVSSTPSDAQANIGGDTDFPKALSDLDAGKASPLGSGGALQPLTVSGSGATASTPLKFMFIVTDGMEDDSPNNGGPNAQNVFGEMTSITAEANGTGACSYLKNTLRYTVYVLYVNYYPIASKSYYSPKVENTRPTDAAVAADYPSDVNKSAQVLSDNPSGTTPDPSPTAQSLQACASSSSDFYEASSSAQIQTALAGMLKSALASTIRLTN